MYKVFIVDDEAAVVKSLCTAIDWESNHFEIAGSFTDPQEALQKLSTERIDLLITDVCMPIMDGLTLMAKAKAILPDLKVIVVSAYDNFGYVKKALKNGAENYLLKPVDQDELTETLQKTVENIESASIARLLSDSNMVAFKNNILERWVRNTISESELMERADLIGINLQAGCYSAILYQDAASPDILANTSKLLAILVEQCPSDINMHFFINSTLQVVGILFGNDGSSRYPLSYHEKISFIARKSKMELFTVVGPVVSSPADIHISYSQAKKYAAAQHAGFHYLDCCDFPESSQVIQAYQENLLKLFDQYGEFNPGELADIARIPLFETIRAATGYTQKKIALSAAVNIYFAFQSNRPDQKLSPSFMDCFSEYASIKNDEIMHWLDELISRAREFSDEKQDFLHPYVRKSIEFIHRESNQDISLKTIAAEFNVSPAYLGQLFRTQTGKYFNDYLTSVRLECSRKLIIETDMRVSDIAIKVGFSSQTYFNRIFKRVYSTSPREYRYTVKTNDG